MIKNGLEETYILTLIGENSWEIQLTQRRSLPPAKLTSVQIIFQQIIQNEQLANESTFNRFIKLN